MISPCTCHDGGQFSLLESMAGMANYGLGLAIRLQEYLFDDHSGHEGSEKGPLLAVERCDGRPGINIGSIAYRGLVQ